MKRITLGEYRVLGELIIAVVMLGVLTACGGSSQSVECEGAPTGGSVAAEQAQVPSWLANSVFDGVGQVRLAANSDSSQRVIVFEEKHTSRAGQIEIAIMLNRLHSHYGLRHLALEGAVLEKDPPDAGWFYKLPDSAARREVALQLLGQGEISAAEFAALVFPDFQIHPIEHEPEYQVDLSDKASSASTDYLIAIAERVLTAEQLKQVNQVCNAGTVQECSDLIFGSDPWIKSHYDTLTRPNLSAAEEIKAIDEIKAKASEVKADVNDYAAALQEERAFFVTACKRSVTMVNNTLPIVHDHSDAPVALDIGAAHTAQVVNLLKDQRISVAAISPLSLSQNKTNGDLYDIAYERKAGVQGPKSVDAAGNLGAFLDGRHKPRPDLNEPWFRLKAPIMYSAIVIARIVAAAGAGGSPPFGLDKGSLSFGGAEIDPSEIQRTGDGGARFPVKIPALNKTLWVLTGQLNPQSEIADDISLEEALKALLAGVIADNTEYTEAKQKEIESKYSADNPAQVHISRDVVAKISDDPNVIHNAKIER